ncbi:hypothetical protein GBF38_005116 [Nibea albiflora]|uniref:Uncharacterized protein n=1 Tax=Nibea albiflora TaxID=240163 RepID=A0ACB7EVU0_NIBAL|nr:hypothetical protein GBF38_005116 [Nibea albiflora]
MRRSTNLLHLPPLSAASLQLRQVSSRNRENTGRKRRLSAAGCSLTLVRSTDGRCLGNDINPEHAAGWREQGPRFPHFKGFSSPPPPPPLSPPPSIHPSIHPSSCDANMDDLE